MAAITVSSMPPETAPPIGVIEAEDTFTAVIPLDDVVVFIAVEAEMRPHLAASLMELARCVGADVTPPEVGALA